MPKPVSTPRIYVDTSVYLDLITRESKPHPETREPRWKSAKALFDAVNDGRVILCASALIEAEVKCLWAVRDGSEKILQLVDGWFTAKSTQWTDVDRFLAREAFGLARKWHPFRANRGTHIGGADATHLAAAVRLHCDYLMTQDGGFPIGQTVEGVEVGWPTEVWPRHLLDDLPVDETPTEGVALPAEPKVTNAELKATNAARRPKKSPPKASAPNTTESSLPKATATKGGRVKRVATKVSDIESSKDEGTTRRANAGPKGPAGKARGAARDPAR